MINLKIHKWKQFVLKDIFKVEKSKNIVSEIAEENIGNEIPYVTRTEHNNGAVFC